MFSILTSKIFGGTTVLLAIALAAIWISKDAVISHQDKRLAQKDVTISDLRQDLATARGNADKFELGMKQCNESAATAAQQAANVAEAGRKALEAVRKAAEASAQASIKRLDQLPRDGTTPAQVCSQADAILLQGAGQ